MVKPTSRKRVIGDYELTPSERIVGDFIILKMPLLFSNLRGMIRNQGGTYSKKLKKDPWGGSVSIESGWFRASSPHWQQMFFRTWYAEVDMRGAPDIRIPIIRLKKPLEYNNANIIKLRKAWVKGQILVDKLAKIHLTKKK